MVAAAPCSMQEVAVGSWLLGCSRSLQHAGGCSSFLQHAGMQHAVGSWLLGCSTSLILTHSAAADPLFGKLQGMNVGLSSLCFNLGVLWLILLQGRKIYTKPSPVEIACLIHTITVTVKCLRMPCSFSNKNMENVENGLIRIIIENGSITENSF